jgi:type I restriction enzyme M protein
MSVSGDTILSQVEFTYDSGGNLIKTVSRERYHNAAASQTGELKNPSETPKARVTYAAMYPDALGRTVATANYGTNGGTALTRSSTVPAGSDTVLVSSTLQQSVRGVEKKPLPHLLCTTNMLLHGIDVPSNIRHDNTLSRPLRDYGPKDRVDCIITNPPFGGMEEDGIESNFPQTFRTRETADLFLVLIMHLLKDGGRGAIVLPDGTLFGEGVKTRIKEKLLTECDLHTIVRLPNGVFAPYTGIKTNLLFFTKGRPTKDVWFYEHPYPPGAKSYNKTKPIRIDEFDVEKAWWGIAKGKKARPGEPNLKKRVENEFAWKVSAEDIAANGFNLDIKNPHNADTGPGDPDELLKEFARVDAEAASVLDELKQELATALGGAE